MDLFSETTSNTFKLLSIGQRGVGKTVFLAGSYSELHSTASSSRTAKSQKLWFDCRDRQVQISIDQILDYIAQTGHYPPATMRIASFDFSLKRRTILGSQTLCHFRWWDVPGEICTPDNADFQTIVSSSNGCCVFIDAHALVHNNDYLTALEELYAQVTTIATQVSLKNSNYAFALILTKCDLIASQLFTQQRIDEGLQPLIGHLDDLRVNYRTFCSVIPVVSLGRTSTLRATGAAAPLLWIVSALRKAHRRGFRSIVCHWLDQRLPGRS